MARQVGIRASAIRYYEQIGILPGATRISGQRRYDQSAIHRLALIRRATQTGFTLDEVRQLFFGFREGTTASKRWRKMCHEKLSELRSQIDHIRFMSDTLERVIECCHCQTLDECGKAIFDNGRSDGGPGALGSRSKSRRS